MVLGGNIIDGRARFGRSANGNSLEERLSRTARVPEPDRPILASNLGKLAARVNRESPLDGAKSMVEATGHEGLWPKRKRFIRLPGEDASGSLCDGVYGASGGTFTQLAKAAGKLLATSQNPETIAHECERAIRATVEGTSFVPTYRPVSSSERTAKGLLDEYASKVAEAVGERTRITELWSVLRDSPFGLQCRREDGEALDLGTYGEAALFPRELLRPLFWGDVVEAAFDPEADHTDWKEPTLELGFVALRFNARMFVVPEDARSLFGSDRENDDGFLIDANEWVRRLRAKHTTRAGLPRQPFLATLGYGWRDVTISVLRRAGLTIVSGADGNPELKLSTWSGDQLVAFNPGGYRTDAFEDRIVAADGQINQCRLVDLDYDETLYALHADPFDICGRGATSPVVGLLDYFWLDDCEIDDMTEAGWTDTPATASFLLNNEHRFIATVPAAAPLSGALRKDSVGAALLHNARVASEDESIPKLLIDKVRRTADAGLRFHEAMLEDYRDALRRI